MVALPVRPQTSRGPSSMVDRCCGPSLPLHSSHMSGFILSLSGTHPLERANGCQGIPSFCFSALLLDRELSVCGGAGVEWRSLTPPIPPGLLCAAEKVEKEVRSRED